MIIASIISYNSKRDVNSTEPVELHMFSKSIGTIPLGLYVRWANAFERKNHGHLSPPVEVFLFGVLKKQGFDIDNNSLSMLKKAIKTRTGMKIIDYMILCLEQYCLEQ